jgi:predicted extracellular nuclease
VSFVDRPGGDATTAVQVTGDRTPALSVSPGRINPASEAWAQSRKPLAGEFVFRGKTVFVVANHFNSKGGDQPMYGRFQPPTRGSETQRLAQASEVNDFVGQIQRIDRRANIVVLGDLNDFQFSPALRELTSRDRLVDLMNELPRDERYSYVFEGNSQALDHVLVSGAMVPDYDVVHVNAEFADQASDHDPQVVRLTPMG